MGDFLKQKVMPAFHLGMTSPSQINSHESLR